MNNDKFKYNCRVCGLFMGEDYPPWGFDGKCCSFDICICCGVQFGYGDCSPEEVKNERKEWLDKGANWDLPKHKPKNWNLEKQLKNISQEFL